MISSSFLDTKVPFSTYTSLYSTVGMDGGDINFASETTESSFFYGNYKDSTSDIDGTDVDYVCSDFGADPLNIEYLDKDGNSRFNMIDWLYLVENPDCTYEELRSHDITIEELDTVNKDICRLTVDEFVKTRPNATLQQVKDYSWSWAWAAAACGTSDKHIPSDPSKWRTWRGGRNLEFYNKRLEVTGSLYIENASVDDLGDSNFWKYAQPSELQEHGHLDYGTYSRLKFSDRVGDHLKIIVTKSFDDSTIPAISMSITYITSNLYPATRCYNESRTSTHEREVWEYGTPTTDDRGPAIIEALDSNQKYTSRNPPNANNVLPSSYLESNDIILPIPTGSLLTHVLGTYFHVNNNIDADFNFRKLTTTLHGGSTLQANEFLRSPITAHAKTNYVDDVGWDLTLNEYFNNTNDSSTSTLDIKIQSGSSGGESVAAISSPPLSLSKSTPGLSGHLSPYPNISRYIPYMEHRFADSGHGDSTMMTAAGIRGGWAKGSQIYYAPAAYRYVKSDGTEIPKDWRNVTKEDLDHGRTSSWFVRKFHEKKVAAGITRPTVCEASIGKPLTQTTILGARKNRVPRHFALFNNETGSVGLRGIFGNTSLIMDKYTEFYLSQVSKSNMGSHTNEDGVTRFNYEPWTTYYGDINDKEAIKQHNYNIQEFLNLYGAHTGHTTLIANQIPSNHIQSGRDDYNSMPESTGSYGHYNGAYKRWWRSMAKDAGITNKYAKPTDAQYNLLETSSLDPVTNPFYNTFNSSPDIDNLDDFFITDPQMIHHANHIDSDGYYNGLHSTLHRLRDSDKLTDSGVLYFRAAGNEGSNSEDKEVGRKILNQGEFPNPKVKYYHDDGYGHRGSFIHHSGPIQTSPQVTCKIYRPEIPHPDIVNHEDESIDSISINTLITANSRDIYQVAFHDPSTEILNKLSNSVTGSIISQSLSSEGILSGSVYDIQDIEPSLFKKVTKDDIFFMPVFLTSFASSSWNAIEDRDRDPLRQSGFVASSSIPFNPSVISRAGAYENPFKFVNEVLVDRTSRNHPIATTIPEIRKTFIDKINIQLKGDVSHSTNIVEYIKHNVTTASIAANKQNWRDQRYWMQTDRSFSETPLLQQLYGPKHASTFPDGTSTDYSNDVEYLRKYWDPNYYNKPELVALCDPRLPNNFVSDIIGLVASASETLNENLEMTPDGWIPRTNYEQNQLGWSYVFTILESGRGFNSPAMSGGWMINKLTNLINSNTDNTDYINLKTYLQNTQITGDGNSDLSLFTNTNNYFKGSKEQLLSLHPSILSFGNLYNVTFSYHDPEWFDGGMKNGKEISNLPLNFDIATINSDYQNAADEIRYMEPEFGAFPDQVSQLYETTYSGMTVSKSIYQYDTIYSGDTISSTRYIAGLVGVLPWFSCSQDTVPYMNIESNEASTKLLFESSNGKVNIEKTHEYLEHTMSYHNFNTIKSSVDINWHRRVNFEQTTSYWLKDILNQPTIQYDSVSDTQYHKIPVHYVYSNDDLTRRVHMYPNYVPIIDEDSEEYIIEREEWQPGTYFDIDYSSNHGLHHLLTNSLTVRGIDSTVTDPNSIDVRFNVLDKDPNINNFKGNVYTGTGIINSIAGFSAQNYITALNNDVASDNLPIDNIEDYMLSNYNISSVSGRYSTNINDVTYFKYPYTTKEFPMYVTGYILSGSNELLQVPIEVRSGSSNIDTDAFDTQEDQFLSEIITQGDSDPGFNSSVYSSRNIKLLPVSEYKVPVIQESDLLNVSDDITRLLFDNQVTLDGERTYDWITVPEIDLYNAGIFGESGHILVVSASTEGTPEWYTGLIPYLGIWGNGYGGLKADDFCVGAVDITRTGDPMEVATSPDETFWVEGGYTGSITNANMILTNEGFRVSHSVSDYFNYKGDVKDPLISSYARINQTVFNPKENYTSEKLWDPNLNNTSSNNSFSSDSNVVPNAWKFHNLYVNGPRVDGFGLSFGTIGLRVPGLNVDGGFRYYAYSKERDPFRKYHGLHNFADKIPVLQEYGDISVIEIENANNSNLTVTSDTTNKRSNLLYDTRYATYRVRIPEMIGRPEADGGYQYHRWFSGTSAAAPNVAGVACLFAQLDPTVNYNSLKHYLNQFSYKNAFNSVSEVGLGANSITNSEDKSINNFERWFHGMLIDPLTNSKTLTTHLYKPEHSYTSIIINPDTEHLNTVQYPGFTGPSWEDMNLFSNRANHTGTGAGLDFINVNVNQLSPFKSTTKNKTIINLHQYSGKELADLIVPKLPGFFNQSFDSVVDRHGVVSYYALPNFAESLDEVIHNHYDGESGHLTDKSPGHYINLYDSFNKPTVSSLNRDTVSMNDIWSTWLAKYGVFDSRESHLNNLISKNAYHPHHDMMANSNRSLYFNILNQRNSPFKAPLVRNRWLIPLYIEEDESYEEPLIELPQSVYFGPHWMSERLRRQYLGTWNNYWWYSPVAEPKTTRNVIHWPFNNLNLSDINGAFQFTNAPIGSNLNISGNISLNVSNAVNNVATTINELNVETKQIIRSFNGQYTAGGELTTINGQDYIGYFHIHYDKGAMEGDHHVAGQHDILIPTTSEMETRIESIKSVLKLNITSIVSTGESSNSNSTIYNYQSTNEPLSDTIVTDTEDTTDSNQDDSYSGY